MRGKRKYRKTVDEEAASRILKGRACHAFYFFTDIGCYTGKLATSLTDFSRKIESLDVASVEFHCARGDFQRWIKECIGDSKLAERISKISKRLEGEKLRKEIHRATENWIKELKKLITS